MKVAILYDNFGPYHYYRLATLTASLEVHGIELFNSSFEYSWGARGGQHNNFISLCDPGDKKRTVVDRLRNCLCAMAPDVLMIAGYSSAYSVAALNICKKLGIRTILSSDSQWIDHPRSWVREKFKSYLVNQFDAAFTAGGSSTNYLQTLGYPRESCIEGMNVVDNLHFSASVDPAKSNLELPTSNVFFLCVARMLPQKNIFSTIEAYESYVAEAKRQGQNCWDLVFAGDGELLGQAQRYAESLNCSSKIHFLGSVEYSKMPALYQMCGGLVLLSRSEPWGLVVNEALAAGKGVIVSRQCGSAQDLVFQRGTGYVEDANDQAGIVQSMIKFSAHSELDSSRVERRAKSVVSEYSSQEYLKNFKDVCRLALSRTPKHDSHFDMFVRSVAITLNGRR